MQKAISMKYMKRTIGNSRTKFCLIK